jgi:hypothetical protein
LSAAAADGLEEECVRGGALSDEGAVCVEGNAVGVTAVTAGATHGEGSGEVATSSASGVNGTAYATTTADGLEEDADGVIASGLDLEWSDLRGGGQGDGACLSATTADAGERDLPAEREGGIGGGGRGVAAENGAALSAAAADGLEKDGVSAGACIGGGVTGDDGE